MRVGPRRQLASGLGERRVDGGNELMRGDHVTMMATPLDDRDAVFVVGTGVDPVTIGSCADRAEP